jgi:predicted RND superfamily exporter protein
MTAAGSRLATIRSKVDLYFAQWARFVFRRAWYVIAACLLVVGGMMSELPKLVVDTSTEGFMHPDDPIRVRYNEFRYQFGRDERVLVIVDSGVSNGVFTFDFLKQLKALHEDLETNTPKLEKVASLVNARMTRGENDSLIVDDFLEEWPETEAQLEIVRQRALNNDIYLNQVVSKDGRYAIIMIENDAYSSVGQTEDVLSGFDDTAAPTSSSAEQHPAFLTGEENTAIVEAVEVIAEKYIRDGFSIHYAGTPHMVDRLTRILMQDMGKFTLYCVLIIVSLLLLAYRRIVMVFVPISVALLSVLTTMGTMAVLKVPVTTAIQIMPSFLITVGIGNAIHIFALFFQSLNRGSTKEEALVDALQHSGLAIVMTGLTTMAGLASFMGSAVKPVSDFGLITPIGVANALIASMVLLPAIIAVLPLKQGVLEHKHENSLNQKFLQFCGRISTTHPWKMILVWMSIIAVSLVLASQMRLSHNPVKWFPKDDPFRITTELLNTELGGGMFLEVLIDTGKENGLQDPDLLNRMSKIHDYAHTVKVGDMQVGKTISMVSIVKETNQALHNNDPAYYAIPETHDLVSQEILLFENSGSEDLRELVDTRFSKARMTMKLPFIDAVNFPAFTAILEPGINQIIGGKATVTITGLMGMMGQTIHNLLTSMVTSYATSFIMISIMMILFMGSFRIGLLGMVCNLTPIVMTMALMVACGFPLDAFTLLIGSIGLGLAVDDTLHFLNNYTRYLHQSHDPKYAVTQTLSTAGEAMFFTSVILAAGFLVYSFATMTNLVTFGILTAFCVGIAFLADVTLNPAIMYLFGKREMRKLAARQITAQGESR